MRNIILHGLPQSLSSKPEEPAKAYIWFPMQRELNWLPLLFTVCVWRRSSTLLFQHFVGSLRSRGDLAGGRTALWTSEHPHRVGTGGTWGGLNWVLWPGADVGFLPSSLQPTPFPKFFIYLVPVMYLHGACLNRTHKCHWSSVLEKKERPQKNVTQHSSSEHVENQEHCLPKRERK